MAKSLDDHIAITPGTLGGKPRIAGHRIAVIHVATWHNEMKMSVAEIAEDYKLSLADVHAALAYYYDHQEEIDQHEEESQKRVEEFMKAHPSKLQQKLLENRKKGTSE